MANTNLSGHSGCKIILVENEGKKPFVRKYSSGVEYNERLKTQCNKQMSFMSDKVKAPKVYDTGYTDDGIFYFDMEYVQGITLAKYMTTMEVNRVRGMVNDIVNNIVCKTNERNEKALKVFSDKLSDLQNKAKKINNQFALDSIAKLKEYDWSRYTTSFCHGDLTLENIIISNNQLYLIDFLDSFYNSWVLDIGKLLQDVQTMWSYRNTENISTNTIIRMIVFRDILLDEICHGDMNIYSDVYHALLLHLVRIYPYAKDKKTIDYLDRRTTEVLHIIKECERKIG